MDFPILLQLKDMDVPILSGGNEVMGVPILFVLSCPGDLSPPYKFGFARVSRPQ